MMEVVGSVLQFRIRAGASSALPNYAVVNEYKCNTKCMGQPASGDLPFSALEAETVVFMFNVSLDGVFCTKPSNECVLADETTNRRAWLDYVLPVHAPENSLFVMGGHFHSQMDYWEEPHDAIMAGCLRRWQNGVNVLNDYQVAAGYYSDSSTRHAWDL